MAGMRRPDTSERYRETRITTTVQIQRVFSFSHQCGEAEREKGASQHPNIPRHVTVSFLLLPLFPPTLPCMSRPSRRINDQSHPATFISRNRPRRPSFSFSLPFASSLPYDAFSSGRRGGLLRDVNFAS